VLTSSKAVDQAVEKVMQDMKQVAAKEVAGLTGGEVKASIFGGSETKMT
jgi:hypothetical protein